MVKDTKNFENSIKHYRKLVLEDTFVKPDEESELPADDDPQTTPQPTNVDQQPEQPATSVNNAGDFTDREVDILNTALVVFRDNPNYSIDEKNDLSTLFDEKRYEDLLSRLMAFADELND